MALREIHILVPGTHDCYLLSKKGLHRWDWVKDPNIERLAWVQADYPVLPRQALKTMHNASVLLTTEEEKAVEMWHKPRYVSSHQKPEEAGNGLSDSRWSLQKDQPCWHLEVSLLGLLSDPCRLELSQSKYPCEAVFSHCVCGRLLWQQKKTKTGS